MSTHFRANTTLPQTWAPARDIDLDHGHNYSVQAVDVGAVHGYDVDISS